MMGRLEAFELELEKSPAVFRGGEEVVGRAVLHLRDSMPVRKVVVIAQGLACTLYPEMETVKDKTTGRHHSRLTHYGREEIYFREQWAVADTAEGSEKDLELPAGTNSFGFKFQLPADIPSSFEHKQGFVRYEVRGVIQRPHEVDTVAKTAFTVHRDLDFKNCEDVEQPAETRQETMVTTAGCIPSGRVSLSLGLEKTGFVPGEAVVPLVQIDNDSNRQVHVTLHLETFIRLHGARTGHQGPGNAELHGSGLHHVKTVKDEIISVKSPQVVSHTMREWKPVFTIPPLPPSGLPGCKNIDIQYKLMAKVHGIGLADNTSAQLDISIGSIPHRGNFRQIVGSQDDKAVVEGDTQQLVCKFADYAGGPFDIAGEGEHLVGPHKFTPLYVCYEFPQELRSALSMMISPADIKANVA